MWLVVTEVTELSRRRRAMCRHSFCCLLDVPSLCHAHHIFRCRVWYHVLSLHYACIQSSGIILIPLATFVPNFVSVATSVAEPAHGEKSCTQSITHPAYLMRWELKLLLPKTLLSPAMSNGHISQHLGPYWSNALVSRHRAPECLKSKNKTMVGQTSMVMKINGVT